MVRLIEKAKEFRLISEKLCLLLNAAGLLIWVVMSMNVMLADILEFLIILAVIDIVQSVKVCQRKDGLNHARKIYCP